jgi:TolB-like protein/Tfp pilus assembly protein PilF
VIESSKAVFLSYASQDAEPAARICASLRAAGVEVWFDQSELRGGDAWDQKIHHQIRDCALFIPIISANSQERLEGYFRLEWDLADQRTHMVAHSKAFIVPVCIDTTAEVGAEVPESFLKVQWTRLPGGETPASFCERILLLLRRPASLGPAPKGPQQAIPVTVARSTLPRSAAIGAGILATAVIGWQGWRMMHPRASPAIQQKLQSAATAAVSSAPEKSIAVLPFVDMSEKQDQAYFSDGLSEELIDLLAKTRDLRVPARTSSFYFKGKQVTITEIARTLNVANILEGSVRKSGNTLRVTAQLIRVADGYHLWSNSYDRELRDIFHVQDDIASEVVRALKIRLVGSLNRDRAPTESTAAHNLLLEARFFEDRYAPGDTERALQSYEKALAEDPNYALAWAELSWALLWQEPFSGKRFKNATLQAVKLGPELAQAHAMRGWYQSQVGGDWVAAGTEFDKALALEPLNTRALWGKGQLARVLRKFDESIRYYQAALDRDPVNASLLQPLSQSMVAAGRAPEAVRYARRSLEISPNILQGHWFLGNALYANGQLEAALTEMRREPEKTLSLTGIALVEQARHQPQASDAALRQLIASASPSKYYGIAAVYAARGDAKAALVWLEHVRALNSPLEGEVSSDPTFNPIRGDAGFKAFLRKMNLPE